MINPSIQRGGTTEAVAAEVLDEACAMLSRALEPRSSSILLDMADENYLSEYNERLEGVAEIADEKAKWLDRSLVVDEELAWVIVARPYLKPYKLDKIRLLADSQVKVQRGIYRDMRRLRDFMHLLAADVEAI